MGEIGFVVGVCPGVVVLASVFVGGYPYFYTCFYLCCRMMGEEWGGNG